VPELIRTRPPTTDTYPLEQSQEEFFFSVPYDVLDLCLWAHDAAVPAEQVAEAARLTPEQVARVYRDIQSKRRAAEYLHAAPVTL
jgi:NAD+ synthase